MKILYVTPINKQYHIFNYYIYKYLEKKNVGEVKTLDYRHKFFKISFLKGKKYSLIGYINNLIIWGKLILSVILYKPDLIFIIKGEIFKKELFRFIRRLKSNMILINWFMDSPHLDSLAIKIASLYDIFFTNDSYSVEKIKKINKNTYFIPFGYIEELHKKVAIEKIDYKKFQCDVLFVGSFSKEREVILNELQEFDMKIYGPGWNNGVLTEYVYGDGLYGEDMVKAFNSAKIVLNIHRNFLVSHIKEKYGNGINLRVFEVLGSGGFLLTDRKKDILKLFKENEDLVCFSSINELKKNIRYYLHNENKINIIRHNGYKKVKKYSLDNILSVILEKVNEYKNFHNNY